MNLDISILNLLMAKANFQTTLYYTGLKPRCKNF